MKYRRTPLLLMALCTLDLNMSSEKVTFNSEIRRGCLTERHALVHWASWPPMLIIYICQWGIGYGNLCTHLITSVPGIGVASIHFWSVFKTWRAWIPGSCQRIVKHYMERAACEYQYIWNHPTSKLYARDLLVGNAQSSSLNEMRLTLYVPQFQWHGRRQALSAADNAIHAW